MWVLCQENKEYEYWKLDKYLCRLSIIKYCFDFGQCYRYFMVEEEASRMCFIKYKWRYLTGHNWNQDKLWRYHYATIVILTMSRGSCFCFYICW